MKRMGKKAISLLLVLVMSLSLITTSGFGFAAGEDESEDTENVIVETADAEEAAEEEEDLSVQAAEATEPAEVEAQAEAAADAATVQVVIPDADTVENADISEADAEEVQPAEDEEETLPEETEPESAEPEEQPDEPEDEEIPEEESAVPDEEEENALIDQTVKVVVYTAATYDSRLINSADITLNGEMPEDASAKAYPVSVDIDDENVLTAYNVTIYDADGNEFQPEDDTVQVTVDHSAIQKAISVDADIQVYALEDEDADAEEITDVDTADDGVTFDVDSDSSVFAVATEDTMATWTAVSDGIRVTATALESALPEDAELSVELYNEDDKEYEAAEDALDLDEDTGMAAMDISFNVNGREVEPDSPVYLSVNFAAVLPEDADADTLEVQHLEENGNDVNPVTVAEAGEEINTVTAVAKFTVESFSTFTVTWEWSGQGGGTSSMSVTVTAYVDGVELNDLQNVTFDSEDDELDLETLLYDMDYNGGDYLLDWAYVTYSRSSQGGPGGGGTTTVTIGTEDDPVVAIQKASGGQSSFYVIQLSGTSTTVQSGYNLNLYVYYTTPTFTVDIDAVAEDEAEDWLLQAKLSHAGEYESVEYVWSVTDTDGKTTEWAEVSWDDETGRAFIIWDEGVEVFDEIVVHVTATITRADGSTESASGSYTLEYEDEYVNLQMTYGPNNTALGAGNEVTLTNTVTGEVYKGTTDSNGMVLSLEIEPGIYLVEATYETSDGSSYSCSTTVAMADSGNYSFNLNYDNADKTFAAVDPNNSVNNWNHVDVKMSTGSESAGVSSSGATVNLVYAVITGEDGTVKYIADDTSIQAGATDNEWQIYFYSVTDGTVSSTYSHSISFASTDTITITYTLEWEDTPGTVFTYTVDVTADTVYPSGTTYPANGQRAYKLYNYLYGTSYSSNAQLIADGVDYIDIGGMSMMLVGAILCDSSTTGNGAGVISGTSGMWGIDFALSVDAFVSLTTNWTFDLEKTYLNHAMTEGMFTFNLFAASCDDGIWSVDDEDDGGWNYEWSNKTAGKGTDGNSSDTMTGIYVVYDNDKITEGTYHYYILSEQQGDVDYTVYDSTVFGVMVYVTVDEENEPVVEATYYTLTSNGDGTYSATAYSGDKITEGDDGYATFHFVNEYSTDVRIVKTDMSGNSLNAEFTLIQEVTDPESGETITCYYDPEAGDDPWVSYNPGETVTLPTVTIGTLNLDTPYDGTYTLTEVTAPDQYGELPGSVVFTVEDGVITGAEIENGDASDYLEISAGGLILTVKDPDTTTALSVEKVWDDENDQDGIRPDEITVQLTADGVAVEDSTLTLEESNSWKGTFTYLPVHNSDGDEIEYSVSEITDLPEGYISEVGQTTTADDGTYNITVTNSHTPETVNISGTKTWDDNDDQDGKRPTEITINLLADGEIIESKTVTAGDNWSWSFTELPKDKDGKEITYSISEDAVDGYTTVIDDYDVINSYTPETTSVTVTKVWDDADNQDGKRPESVNVDLYADGEKIDSAELRVVNTNFLDRIIAFFTGTLVDDWTYTWDDLPVYKNGEEIVYTVVEDTADLPDGYECQTGELMPNGDGTYSVVITNSYTPETIAISGTKTWDDADDQDGKRPAEITINLLADGDPALNGNGEPITATVSEGEDWSWSFTGLPKYSNGSEITYTITEDEVDGYTTEINGYDVTNSYTPETIDISGTKTWDDADDQDGKRPDEITINLLADGEPALDEIGQAITATVSEGDEWTWSFTDLPKYSNGSEITYTITEDEVDGYTTEIDGYDVTNIHKSETIDISGSKVWDDNNNQDGVRPESVTINLLSDEEIVASKVVTAEDNWLWSFTDLPKYAAGQEIEYTVSEDLVEFYDTEITWDAETGFTVTNSHSPDQMQLSGEKIWDDGDDQDGKRPTSVTIRLYADGTEISSTEATGDDWNWTFRNLDVYRDGGIPIVYTITEDAVDGYTTTIDGMNVINSYEPGKTSLPVIKAWDDGDDQDGIRPGSVTVELIKNDEPTGEELVLTADDGWTGTFSELDEYTNGVKNVYTVSEAAVAGYESVITGDTAEGYTITNTHKTEATEISGSKTWDDGDNQDGFRPDSITVRLFADGEPALDENGEAVTATVTEADSWSWTFTDLAKNKDGKEITYSVTEDAVEGYETTVSGCDVTNRYTPETVDISGSKIWDDDDDRDGIRPGTITVHLYADGEDTGKSVTVGARKASLFDRIVAFFDGSTVAESGDWSWSFTDLPKYSNGTEIEYTVVEEVVNGYTMINDGDDIINRHTPETIDISGSKIWDDHDDQDGLRPDEITISLLADGAAALDQEGREITTVVTAEDDWYWSFEGLNRYRDGGTEIEYTVTENAVVDYEVTYSEDTFTITNTHTPETIDISGSKTWDDADNQDGKRPTEITINLLADGETIDSRTVTAGNGWSWNFTDLPRYSDGVEIAYTVTEDAIDNYATTYDEGTYDITNTYTPEQTSVTVIKAWDDAGDQDGARPASVKVVLVADGKVTDQILTLDESNNWTGSFTELDKYSGGEEIVYTVDEISVDGYTSAINGDATTGYVITNSHETEKIDISGSKTWDDADDQDGKRPAEITINLLANGEVSESRTVTASDNWSWSFEDLDKYSDGVEIIYTITEDAIEGYDTTINGYKVINTHEPELINPEPDPNPDPEPTPEPTPTPNPGDLTVTKVWNDDEDKDGIQPDEVIVQLTADGEPYKDAVTLNSENDWTYTWTGLYKYAEGKEIIYDVTEIYVPDGYSATYEGSVEEGAFIITNTHVPETIDIPVQKTWEDNDDAYGHRPDSIEVELLADEDETDVTLSLSEENNWTGVFEDLPKYDTSTGEEIVYSVKELSDEALQYYTPKINGDAETGFTIINQREYFDIDEEIVPDENNRNSWVKNGSVNEYNAIEIEMSTYLPIIETDELANGSFTMNFHDVLDSQLVLDEIDADFSVYISRSAVDKFSAVNTFAADTESVKLDHQYYTVTIHPDDGCSFHVDVDLTAMYLDGVISEDDLLGDTEIMIFFYADLEGTGLNGSYKSTVWYEVYDGEERQYLSNEDVVEVYTYEISVLKYDATELEGNDYEGAALAGATLGLYYDETGEDPVTRNGAPYTEVSGEDGIAMFYGLAEDTYYIIELEAPDGYELSSQVLEVTISADDMDSYIYETQFANLKVAEKSVNVGDGTEVAVGEELTYTITYYNDNETEADVQIVDTLDDGVDFVSATDGGVYDADAHEVTWTIESVPAYSSGSVDLTVVVNENAKTAAGVENTADVQIEDHAVVTTNPVDNPLKPDDPVDPEKSANVATGSGVAVGDEVTYTITYYNNNNTEADVVITDVLDEGVDFVSATDGGVYDADTHTVTWTIQNVAAFTEGSVELTVVVNENAEKTEDIENTAGVKIGNEVSVDTNTVDIPVEPEEPTAPEKSANVDTGASVAVGDDITYTITYYNNYAEATTVVITDVLDAGVDFVSATDGGVYDADTHTVIWTIENAPALTEGSVDLTVTVNGDAQRADGVSNTASVQIGNDSAVDTNTVYIPLEETESSTPDNGGNNGGTTGGNNGNNGGTTSGNGGNTGTSKTLPQTGQLNWPIWLFGGLGIIVLALGIVMILTSKKGKREV